MASTNTSGFGQEGSVWDNMTSLTTTPAPQPRSAADHVEHEIRRNLWMYVSPIILIAGSLGNLMSFLVLQTKSFRHSSVGFVLSCLAVVDTCLLNTALMRQWILHLDPTLDIRAISDAGCKIHVFLTYFLPHLSSWTLVLLTVERALSVLFPLRVRQLCSKWRIIGAWTAIAVLLAGLNGHFIRTFHLMQYRSSSGAIRKVCYVRTQYRGFWFNYWSWIDFSFLSFIPSAIIFTGNILIIYHILQARKLRRRCSNIGEQNSSNQSTRSTTSILIAVSAAFLLLTIPNVSFFIGLDDWSRAAKQAGDKKKLAQLALGFTITNLMFYLNSGINFLLYCLMGSQFRRALKALVTKVSHREDKTRHSSTKQSLLPMTPPTPASSAMSRPAFHKH